MRFLAAIAVLLALNGVVTAAHAEYEPPRCAGLFPDRQTKAEFDAAEKKLDLCWRAAMGVVPLERRVARGEQVFRALIVRGERQLPLFVEFLREPDGGVWLNLGTTYVAAAHLHFGIPASRWPVIAARWQAQPDLVAQARAVRLAAPKPKLESVCIPRWDAAIEVVGPGSIVKTGIGGCDEDAFLLVDFFLDEAAKDAPCAKGDDSADLKLERCLIGTD